MNNRTPSATIPILAVASSNIIRKIALWNDTAVRVSTRCSTAIAPRQARITSHPRTCAVSMPMMTVSILTLIRLVIATKRTVTPYIQIEIKVNEVTAITA